MTEEQIHLANETEEAEATLVAPRFDERAEETARPVVPLSEEAAAQASFARTFGLASPRALLRARPSWLIALLVASLLVGTVLGGVGLRLYQKHRTAAAAPASNAATQQTDTTTPQAQAETAPATSENLETATTENAETAAIDETQPTGQVKVSAAAEERSAKTETPAEKSHNEHDAPATHRSAPVAEPRREAESQPVRHQHEPQASAGGDERSDERADTDEVRPRRVESEKERRRELKKEAEYDVDQNARMVGRITYGTEGKRRQRRRGQYTPDRVRGIFEGTSPQ